MYFSIIAAMFAAGRMFGIGPLPLRWLSLFIIGLVFAFGSVAVFGSIYAAPLGLVTPWAATLGHGRFFAMKGANLNDPAPEDIERFIALPLWDAFKRSTQTPAYSIFCMAVKGFLIALPLGIYAPVGAVVWPLAYFYSWKWFNTSAIAEYYTMGTMGVLIAIIGVS